MISELHFIRPLWLLALLPLTALVLAIWRYQNASEAWRSVIAPHLLPFLLSGKNRSARFSPLLLIAAGWAAATIAVAGPTWKRQPAPFADDTAALAIVVKLTPSMMVEDVPPNRLARSVQKIHDLLAQRGAAKTALIVYAGSAHCVVPITNDGAIIESFAGALSPEIMPADGDVAADAMKQADQVLAGTGSILWITDSIAPQQIAPLDAWRANSRTSVRLLAPLTSGAELDALSKSARSAGAEVLNITTDDSDVSALARAAKFEASAVPGEGERWQESGYWLSPLPAILMLPFFRKGWMVPTARRG